MALMLLRRDGDAGALVRPPSPVGHRLELWLARFNRWSSPQCRRGVLAATAALGVLVFVLGGGNRFTRGPLFLYIPEVELVPPLGRAAWQQAFVVHQQSPLFALCGGYQVGGMESLTVYQMLYMWEWLRTGTLVMLCGSCLVLAAMAAANLARTKTRSDVVPLIGLAWLGAAYLVLRFFADHAGLFAAINIGQHRHALDVTFASVALALLLAAIVPAAPGDRASPLVRFAWAIPIALDIAFGALLEALDAGVLWRTFPGYADGVLPASDRLFAFIPVWRNLAENGYLVQACHRVLSVTIWIAALVALAAAMWRGRRYRPAVLLFALITLDGALGAAALVLGEPAPLSIAHQLCAIFVLAAALAQGSDSESMRTTCRI